MRMFIILFRNFLVIQGYMVIRLTDHHPLMFLQIESSGDSELSFLYPSRSHPFFFLTMYIKPDHNF